MFNDCLLPLIYLIEKLYDTVSPFKSWTIRFSIIKIAPLFTTTRSADSWCPKSISACTRTGCVLEYCNFIFAIYSLLVLLFYYDISKLSVKFTWYLDKYTCIFTNFSFSSLGILICFTKMQQLCSKKNLKSNFEISLIFAGRFIRQSHWNQACLYCWDKIILADRKSVV